MISLFVTHVETYCVHKSLFILQNHVHNCLLDLLDLMLDGSWVETSYEIVLWFIFLPFCYLGWEYCDFPFFNYCKFFVQYFLWPYLCLFIDLFIFLTSSSFFFLPVFVISSDIIPTLLSVKIFWSLCTKANISTNSTTYHQSVKY